MPQSDRRFNLKASLFIGTIFQLLVFSCSKSDAENSVSLEVKHIELQSPDDIISLNDSLVPPILYSHIKGIDTLALAEKRTNLFLLFYQQFW